MLPAIARHIGIMVSASLKTQLYDNRQSDEEKAVRKAAGGQARVYSPGGRDHQFLRIWETPSHH